MNPRMNRCISAILLCFCMISFCFAQQKPYRITIKWNNEGSSCDGKMAYLTGFHGDEVQVYDSVVVRKGTSVFKGKSLPDGLYQVKAGNANPIHLVISESRKFTYWNDAPAHIEGSAENEAYQMAHFRSTPTTPDGPTSPRWRPPAWGTIWYISTCCWNI